jgi:hypothetical protein
MSPKNGDWAIYDIDIFNLLKIYPNVTYSTKTFKFINTFPNIRNKQIMNHMNLSQMTKFNHHTLNAFFLKIQATNSFKHHVDISEHAHNSIYINIYNQKNKMFP